MSLKNEVKNQGGEDFNPGGPAEAEKMDYGRGFRFVFTDKEWVSKILIGILISLVPILNFAVSGYSLEVIRRIVGGDESLPNWGEKLGQYFKEGFFVLVLQISYYLPTIVLGAIGLALMFGSFGAGSAALFVVAVVLFIAAGLFGLTALIALPMATLKYAVSERLGSGYEIKAVFKSIGMVLGEYILAGVIVLAVTLAFSLIFTPISLMPFLGGVIGYFLLLAVSVYIGWLGAHYLAQIYFLVKGKKVEKGEEMAVKSGEQMSATEGRKENDDAGRK